MQRLIYARQFLDASRNMAKEYLPIYSICCRRYNAYLKVSNVDELCRHLDYLYNCIKVGKIFFDFLKFLNYLEDTYRGKKARGNLRFPLFIFSKEHIDSYILHLQASRGLKELNQVFIIFKNVGVVEGCVILDKERSLGQGETKSRRLLLLENFVVFCNIHNVDMEGYFRYFFKDFMLAMVKKDPSSTPGFWFSLSVVNSYILYKQGLKRSGGRMKVIEAQYK